MKKEQEARNLYFQTDLSVSQIAQIARIPRRTVHFWIHENNWDRQKQSAEHMPSLLAENVYHLISRFTTQLMGEDRIMRPVTHKEAETLHKLMLTVNKLKKGSTLNESMELFGLFMEHVNKTSPELADKIMPVVEDFIGKQSLKHVAHFRGEQYNSMGLIPTPPHRDPKEIQLDLADFMDWNDQGFMSPAEENINDQPQPANTTEPTTPHQPAPAVAPTPETPASAPQAPSATTQSPAAPARKVSHAGLRKLLHKQQPNPKKSPAKAAQLDRKNSQTT